MTLYAMNLKLRTLVPREYLVRGEYITLRQSCGESAGLGFGKGESLLDELCEVGDWGSIREKMRQVVSQGAGDDGFGRDDSGTDSA